MTKKLTVITTGGTIGSILQADSISVDASEHRIAQEIEKAKHRLGYSVEVISALNKNSESLSPSDWTSILRCLKRANDSDCDGIVVTHGTDTMAYTVSAAVAYNSQWKKKICFTGAYHAPDHPSSDTSLSLLAALEFAASNHPANGIYVAFRSNPYNSEAKIVHGSSLKPMDFDRLFFDSVYDDKVSVFNANRGVSRDVSLTSASMPCLGTARIPNETQLTAQQHRIACLSLYPGIDRALLDGMAADRKILIVQMYHSGTGPSGPEYRDLVDFVTAKSSETEILMGTFPRKHIDVPYGSTRAICSAGAHVYANLQTHFLYVFSLLALSLDFTNEDILDRFAAWRV